ncbi:hypothetical protein [Pontibacter rugosus]|uniref:Uncharacterized protein n=1 Tax=Pontibacter rugosus TaxID=1745966 RepID=A0ABW3SKS6_9BACT
MNKLFMLLLALLLASTTSAQTEFANFKVAFSHPSHTLTTVNKTGTVCILTFEKSSLYNSAYSSIIDTLGQRIAAGSRMYNPSDKAESLGLIGLADDFIYYEMSARDKASVQPYRIEASTGQVTTLAPLTPSLDAGSEFIQAFTSDSQLYTLHYSNKTNRMQVCVFKDGSQFILKSFNTPFLRLNERLFKGEKPTTPVFVDKSTEQTLSVSSRQKKIYHESDNIYIVFDGFGAQRMNISNLTTEVLQLNLSTEKADFSALPMVSRIRPIGINSYVHEGILYRFLLTPNYDMHLSAFDLETMAPRKEYLFKSNEPLTLKASPVFSNTIKPSKADTAVVEQTESVIKKIAVGTAAMYVEEVHPLTLQVTLGNYTLTNGNAAYLPTGTSLLSSLGPAAIPVVAALTAAKVQAKNTGESITSFKVFLNATNFEPTAPVKQHSYLEQISAYDQLLTEQKVQATAPFAYTYQNKMYYGYLDRKDKTLHLVSFSK